MISAFAAAADNKTSPSITAQNRVLMIEAEVINDGRLRPGSFARADIVSDNSSLALAVPNNAIVTFAGIDKVISVQDGKAVEKPVTRFEGYWTFRRVAMALKRKSAGIAQATVRRHLGRLQ